MRFSRTIEGWALHVLDVELRLGFVDAAVIRVVERLREPKLATLDHRHFATVRTRHVAGLELIPA